MLDSVRVKNVENHCFKANGQIQTNLYFVLIHKPKKLIINVRNSLVSLEIHDIGYISAKPEIHFSGASLHFQAL